MAEKEKKAVAEGMVTVIIDPKRTRGGIRVNGKLYVGKVTVSSEQADDLLRIQEEFSATIDKLTEPSTKLRNQNIGTTKKMYMADPTVYGTHPQFSNVYGMLDPFQWQFISDVDKEEWREERLGVYGY